MTEHVRARGSPRARTRVGRLKTRKDFGFRCRRSCAIVDIGAHDAT